MPGDRGLFFNGLRALSAFRTHFSGGSEQVLAGLLRPG
jgi:hypothetical protein